MSVCIYDSKLSMYKTPFGAVKVNETVTFNIHLPVTSTANSPTLIVYKADVWNLPLRIPMKFSENSVIDNVFTCTFTPTQSSLLFYCFEVVMNREKCFIKKGYDGTGVLGLSDGNLWQMTVYSSDMKTSEFMKNGVMYQIFPDRFYNSGMPKDNVPADRVMHDNWFNTPQFRPNSKGEVLNNDYFGGDFKGIEEKIPYLKKLGVTSVYVNPVFEAHSNHRYNVADYTKPDSLLGTEEDFISLCATAKENDIAIIIDAVFSHTGSDSIYFNKEKRYGEGGAYNDPESPYRSWYQFGDGSHYESWWGFTTLPNTNEIDESFSEYICGKNGVIRKWLSMGARGLRLDVADELPDEFLDKIYSTVKGYDKECIVIGEVWEDASTKISYGQRRRYLLGQQLDSVMNYPFKDTILSYIRYGNGSHLYNTVMSILENYPQPVVNALMNSLSTHDVERAMTVLVNEPLGINGREWQYEHHNLTRDQYEYGKILFKLASILQFTFPGTPCIYYGDEAGLFGYKDPFNRMCFPWGREDCELTDFIALLGMMRIEIPIFSEATFLPITFSDQICSFSRTTPLVSIYVAINRTDTNQALIIPNEFLHSDEILTVGEYKNQTLGGLSAVILKVE